MKVLTDLRLTVTASENQTVSYTWKGPSSPGALDAAPAAGPTPEVSVVHRGEWCTLTALAGTSVPGGELVVAVPRSVRQSFLDTRSGALSVKGLSGEIAASTGAGNVELDGLSGSISARTGGGAISGGAVDGSLYCLSGGGNIIVERVSREAVLESAGGEIRVGQAGSRLRLSTAGNIQVRAAAGDVFAFTRGGVIEVEQASGMVTAENAGGGITIGSARGARCETARGTIRLSAVSGSLRASTASGHVFVTLAPGLQLENSFLATGRGDITVSVPSKLAVTVKALNDSARWAGQVISDFSEIQVRSQEVGSSSPVVAQGSLNGGGPVLMLTTSNGSIYLRRLR